MCPSISEARTGWSFNYQTDASGGHPPPGGLVLTNVQHSLHNFARDMRLIGVRLTVQEVDPPSTVVSTRSVFLPLSNPPFTVGLIQLRLPLPAASSSTPGRTFQYLQEADEALQFRTFFHDTSGNYLAFALRADYTLPPTYFTTNFPNCIYQSLDISQRFLFSPRGNDPRHEPSGGLYAARCHPIVKFEFARNESVDMSQRFTRIESIRFDYRMHLFLDRHHDLRINQTLEQLGNQAGLFRDGESLRIGSAIGGGIGGGLSEILGGIVPAIRRGVAEAVSAALFAAIEKPLVLEVATVGLDKGLSVFSAGGRSRLGWDNVHWWAVRGTGTYISAPGAFHAAHIHWRWGAPASGGPQFDTSGVPVPVQQSPLAGGIRGALVDPEAWIQTIRVAVTRNERALDPTQPNVQLENLCRADWLTLFTGLRPTRPTPQDIFSGGDLVFWYSTEVHRSVTIPAYESTPSRTYTGGRKGSVFLHGIFFAHDPEIGGVQVGTTQAQHWPKSISTIRSSPEWFRTAE
jgi:hypothetical protein